jgi:antirestriction protein
MKTISETPRIYVGTYAKYNNGSLEGDWLDLTDYDSKEDFYKACAELHKDESDPEFMFQDREGIPECMVSESWIADNFWEYLEAMEDLHDHEKEAFQLWLDNESHDLSKEDVSDLIEDFRESYQGHYRGGMEQYAEQCVDEGLYGEIPDSIVAYIDYEKIARDYEASGEFWESDGHIFRSI